MSQATGGERRTELDISLRCAGPPDSWWAEVRVRGEPVSRTFTSIPAWLDYLRQLAEPADAAQRGLR